LKIQIVQLGRIGDMILATPMFSAIKHKFPQSHIDIITGTKNFTIISQNPNIHKVKILDKNPLKLFGFVMNNLKENYDYHIDPKDHYSSESKLLALITKAKVKIGYNKPNSKIFSIALPSDTENKGLHYTQRCFNALAPLGIEMPDFIPKPELYPSETARQNVKYYLYKYLINKEIVLINISASMPHKMWQTEKWILALNEIKSAKYTFIISSAPKERNIAKNIAEQTNSLLFEPNSLDEVMHLIKHCSLLITPDTSLVHIAAAFNIPLIGIFSGLDEFYSKFRPLSDKYLTIRASNGYDSIHSVEHLRLVQAWEEFHKKYK